VASTSATPPLLPADEEEVPRAARYTLSSVALPSLLTGVRYAATGSAVGGATWVGLLRWTSGLTFPATASVPSKLALGLSLPYLVTVGGSAGAAAAILAAASATVGAVAGGAARVVSAATRRVLGDAAADAAVAADAAGGGMTLASALDRVQVAAVGAVGRVGGGGSSGSSGGGSGGSGAAVSATGGGWRPSMPGAGIARGVAQLAVRAVVGATRSRLASTVPGGLNVPLSPALAARVVASQAAAAAVSPYRTAITGVGVGLAVLTAVGAAAPFLVQLALRK